MSDTDPTAPRKTDRWLEPGSTNAQVIYFLYLACFVVGITAIVGVVMAYMNRGKAGGMVETHYTFLIRTFWIGLAYALISAVLIVAAIGVVLMLAVAIWIIARCLIGLQALQRNEPIKNPTSWVLGT